MQRRRKLDEDIEELHVKYYQDRDVRVRDRLVKRYSTDVRAVADKLAYKIKDVVFSNEDFFSIGAIGLLRALEKYHPKPHQKFLAYALPRIHGAMIDALREVIGRTAYRDAKENDEVHLLYPVSLSTSLGNEDSLTILDVLVDPHESIEKALVRKTKEEEISMYTSSLMATLTPTQYLIVYLRDFAGWTHVLIGSYLGCSESNACQIYRNALKHLQKKYKTDYPPNGI
jgi:RNA polymerase sigma factor (sigma-70 family)